MLYQKLMKAKKVKYIRLYLESNVTKDYQTQTDDAHRFEEISERHSFQMIEIPNFNKTTDIVEAFHDSKSIHIFRLEVS